MATPALSTASNGRRPACKHLVLDAGPLLSLSPLRGLSETYYTVPQVLDELKDKNAREHFERLGLSAGVSIAVKAPMTASVAHGERALKCVNLRCSSAIIAIQWAKKTGDYSVLSHADLCVLALTYELDQEQKALVDESRPTGEPDDQALQEELKGPTEPESAEAKVEESPERDKEADVEIPDIEEPLASDAEEPPPSATDDDDEDDHAPEDSEPLDVELQPIRDENIPDQPSTSSPVLEPSHPPPAESISAEPTAAVAEDEHLYDDPSDDDDGEGEWITPSNVALYKSRALDLLPSEGPVRKGKRNQETVLVGCMTADFAMQNVLLQMGLGLVSVEGKRIERVKSWVLRCHACFKYAISLFTHRIS